MKITTRQICLPVSLLFLLMTSVACSSYLDKIPNPTLAIPNRLEDVQALLADYNLNNRCSPLATVMADEYFVFTSDFNSVTNSLHRNLYLWLPDESNNPDWNNVYGAPIIISNTALDYAKAIAETPENTMALADVKGRALFFRSFYYYSLAQLFAQPFSPDDSQPGMGIPVRLSSDFNAPTERLSVTATYNQIVADLKIAEKLLPTEQILKTAPTKAAVYGMLARVYLAMSNIDSAHYYADRCILTYGEDHLMDFNELDPTSSAPFQRFNPEVIFHAVGPTSTLLATSRARIDSSLVDSYDVHDLRKQLYYVQNDDGTYQFKGDYDGRGASSGFTFGGITLDEQYLIRAETAARMGNVNQALDDLNGLLRKRWARNSFQPYNEEDPDELLRLILSERRKELIFRGTRWTDMRRLMHESDNAVVPARTIDGKRYELLPGSPRYTLKIPSEIIALSGISQNP